MTASGTSSAPSGSGTSAPIGGGATTHKSNVGAIAGGVVGGIVLLALIVFGVIFMRRKARQSAPATEYNPAYGEKMDMGYTGTVSSNFTGNTGKAYVSTKHQLLPTHC